MISVVIPIYNVEKYLDACLQSVVNQSYRDLEIILVDDGSTDSCGVLCDKWEQLDERIKVIHKKNGGLSSARNAGIEIASGEYLSFIDSDDIIYRDMLYELYKCFCENPKMQIAGCGYSEVINESEIPVEVDKKSYRKLTGEEAVLLMLNPTESFNVVAWNKLYRKSMFDSIKYPEGFNHEDMYVTPRLLYESEEVAYIPCSFYFHRYNPKSIVHSKYSLKSQDEIRGVEAMRDYLMSVDFSKALAYVNRIYLWKLIDHIGKTHYFLPDKKDIEKDLVEKYKKAYIESKKNLIASFFDMLQFRFFCFMPNVYIFIRRKKYLKG